MKILDTTLRDGSYTVNFGFDGTDTFRIASALDHCGVDYIEVGHGNGLNANMQTGFEPAVCPDETYMQAAGCAVKNGKWGMFFIPGIGTVDDIRCAADHGMGFIRIGTEPEKIRQGVPFIEEAKKHGMTVFCNIMKSYAVPPDEFGSIAAYAEGNGADYIVIVDSAGGMLTDDVKAYCEAVKREACIPFGIHAHNNMGLAVANTLQAFASGATVLDGSLRGIGRSAGNASVEMLLFALQRMRVETDIDVYGLLEIAEKHIDPILYKGLRDSSISIVSGFAEFHSSFLGKINHYAELYDVDPKRLIARLTQVNKTGAPDALVESLAREMKRSEPRRIYRAWMPSDTENGALLAEQVFDRMRARARKRMLSTVLVIEQNDRKNGENFLSGVTVENDRYIVANVAVSDKECFERFYSRATEQLDYVLVDVDAWNAFADSETTNSSKRKLFHNANVWASSIRQFVLHLSGGDCGARILLIGETKAADICGLLLRQCGYTVDDRMLRGASYTYVICFAPWDLQTLTEEVAGAIIIDAAIGSLQDTLIADCLRQGVRMVRSDMRAALMGEVEAVIDTDMHFECCYGSDMCGGVRYVAGGCIGQRGDIVVDRISAPSEIYGVADGRGFLLPKEQYQEKDKQNLQFLRDKMDME